MKDRTYKKPDHGKSPLTHFQPGSLQCGMCSLCIPTLHSALLRFVGDSIMTQTLMAFCFLRCRLLTFMRKDSLMHFVSTVDWSKHLHIAPCISQVGSWILWMNWLAWSNLQNDAPASRNKSWRCIILLFIRIVLRAHIEHFLLLYIWICHPESVSRCPLRGAFEWPKHWSPT